ncbi:MAG: hypothetical protein L0207_04065 [Chlamydiae bacterium]|nr:hypothetical protein [Chlamydiota bacterium]
MKVAILNPSVKKNVLLFRELFRRLYEKRKKEKEMEQKIYKAFINRHTGEIALRVISKERDWKPIVIELKYLSGIATEFEIMEPEKMESEFTFSDLEPLAYKVMGETIKTLNSLCFDPTSKGEDIEKIYKQLSDVEIDETEPNLSGKPDLIKQAWHKIDREEAERLLEEAVIGAFLFRKDKFTTLLERDLNKNGKTIDCFNITYKEWDEKISEKILLCINDHKWAFYNDDLDLECPFFETLDELLASEGDIFRKPLWNEY